MFQKLIACAALFTAAACSSVVPSTAMRLNALDPFTADPRDIAVALDLPAGLALVPNTTEMRFKAVHSPSGETHERTYVLQEQRLEDGIVIYTLSARDIADLEAMKTALWLWQDTTDGNSTLSMVVHTDPCRLPDFDVGPDPRLTVLLRLEEGGPLRPLLRDASILEYFDLAAIAELPQCSGPF